MNKNTIFDFYKGKKILITGHTGFKGSWMTQLLVMAGAEVTGYALEAPTNPDLFHMLELEKKIHSVKGDIRDLNLLKQTFEISRPEIVIHMAAQPIVRASYKDPVGTYETNVMGTVNILECVRETPEVASFINVTTDKVYLNKEWEWGYRESDELNGYDPYSNSKSCSELVTSSYKNSFFSKTNMVSKPGYDAEGMRICAISTCRAGNVIGGGDFAEDRIIPDCIRALEKGEEIMVRNPFSVRPYQHVLEPVTAYLYIAMEQYKNHELAGNYNIGPNDTDCVNTGELVTMFCEKWNLKNTVNPITWKNLNQGGPHEAGFLKLDCSKVKKVFAWEPKWTIQDAMEKIVDWNGIYLQQGNVADITNRQIEEYLE